jgi:putative CocE/NonD family hydrolase
MRDRLLLAVLATALLAAVAKAEESRRAEERSTAQPAVRCESNVKVPLRDGVQLATDLYIPEQDGQSLRQRLPTLLVRTPYGKGGFAAQARLFAANGYLVAIQDCRGRFDSEGEFFPFRDDPQDGHDAVVWLGKHPCGNGKVGMYGCSYMAWVQFHAATQNPPGLAALVPWQGPTNAYQYSLRTGGALHLGLLQWIIQEARNGKEARHDPAAASALAAMGACPAYLDWCAKIPWQRGQTPLARTPHYEDAAFQLYFEHNDYTDFWRQPGFAMDEYFDRFPDLPILWVCGWYDWYPRTISDGYQKMVQRGRRHQFLLIGPWTHHNFNSTCGDVNFGDRGAPVRSYDEFLQLELKWFNRWLKGDLSVELGKPVQVFVMGGGDGRKAANGRLNHGGRWYCGDAWPPAETRNTAFYLHEDRVLRREEPTQKRSASTYAYDPRNTVSSNGRCIVSYVSGTAGFRGMGPRDQIELPTLPGHGVPGRRIADRPDVLVFRTPPLAARTAIAGDSQAVLWVSSDAPDTDFFVKLIDEYPASADYPQGYGFPVSEGILRARYRDSFERPSLMEPGRVYRIEIPLEPSANLFDVGHRIRLDIYSSSFPNFDINPNTGNPDDRQPRVAANTIHHDAQHKSFISLPLCPVAALQD